MKRLQRPTSIPYLTVNWERFKEGWERFKSSPDTRMKVAAIIGFGLLILGHIAEYRVRQYLEARPIFPQSFQTTVFQNPLSIEDKTRLWERLIHPFSAKNYKPNPEYKEHGQ